MKQGILIPPIPKEYITYSEQEMIKRTESIYEEIDDLYKKVDVIEDKYREKTNRLLENKVGAASLCELMKEEDVKVLCRALNEFHVLKKISQIAEMEEVFSEPCVLQNFDTMEEAVSWLQLCIFTLRKFELDREYDDELLLLVKEKKVSYIYIAEIIRDSDIVQKIYTTEKVTRYLYENGQKREALLLVMRLEQMLTYSNRKIMSFAMLLLDMGEGRLAYEVLMKYQNPNEEIKQLQTELSALL